MRQSDGAQAMFGRFFIAPLIEEGDSEPVMTGGIIIIDLQLSVESGLGLLPFSQFQVRAAELLLQMTDILLKCLDFFQVCQCLLRFSLLETDHAHEQIDLRNKTRLLLAEGSGARVLVLGSVSTMRKASSLEWPGPVECPFR